MNHNLKDSYISFFIEKGHAKLDSASVIPVNDPTCLFNTAGMQPIVPFLLGEPHHLGKRLVNFQKCFRLTDLDSVGDKTHHTFFEMLGNWSLGDYFKKESITWSYEFLTEKLMIPIEKLAVTVFEGNEFVERDEESAQTWLSLGIPKERISYLPAEDNWWPSLDQTGPCGPDTEIFYWSDTENPAPPKHDPTDNRWVEIWNNVFMQYKRLENGEFVPLSQKNVDTGMGVERVTALLAGVDDNYKTDIWLPIIKKIEDISKKIYDDENYTKSIRIVADHMRAIVMIASDDAGIRPSNTDRGYILRRLIRRMVRYMNQLGVDISTDFETPIVDIIVRQFSSFYEEVHRNKEQVLVVIKEEKDKFAKTLEKGLGEIKKALSKLENGILPGDVAFKLYDTYGFPIELTEEVANEKNISVDLDGFREKVKEHQDKSRVGADKKFKGGLAESNPQTARLHTATHLLQAALKKILGNDISQKGSNITIDRLRFDFNFPRKLTSEEIQQVEDLVNVIVQQDLIITHETMNIENAYRSGAIGVFGESYGENVLVYNIGDFSKEICGGPHANSTRELGVFKILKEESISSGVRRIKAVTHSI
ncbi:alanine--tRNA ligase [Paenibacillus baekrokdamisoli]|uniref:Alanine--tRNA ligase n=1 Tax=Paenibacillus baekrokdamisoli TaxID=1712516 RepID=A0A3G9IVR5_9BACL|nr:alanine--tRNA ligase [Paenibacillus baekrokdamisoli]MBB3068379.1 alanyl-tRNA synthetase [Paenibacillus baekrokdamisoli]BBH22576.1 alanine--tRNA ligase [Paenibacillus baekrokdamisoli]